MADNAANANPEFRHTLEALNDSDFLRFGPRESLWLQKLRPGDKIVCCHGCRRVFYSEDWAGACPLCGCREPLYFLLGANQLLWRERTERNGCVVEQPLRAWRVRLRKSTDNSAEISTVETELELLKAEKRQIEKRARDFKIALTRLAAVSAMAALCLYIGVAVVFAIYRWIPLLIK